METITMTDDRVIMLYRIDNGMPIRKLSRKEVERYDLFKHQNGNWVGLLGSWFGYPGIGVYAAPLKSF